MPIARSPTPPPAAIKHPSQVLDSLNAWTANDDEDERPKRTRSPLGYINLGQNDANGQVSGWLQLFDSESDNFNYAIGLVIIANAIVIGLETDYGMSKFEFTICEHIFNAVFLSEMLIRIFQIGCEYFQDIRYLFDCTLVVSGTLDLWILPFFSGPRPNLAYQFYVMRLVRILRLFRVLRVIRLLRMYNHLLLIAKAFGKALHVVLLISLIIVIMIYAFSIVLTQRVGHHTAQWGDRKDEADTWFGTIPISMTTLFWVMFGCGWTQLLDLLTEVYPTSLVLFFFAVYMVISVSLMSLIIGLISESLILSQQEFKQRKLDSFAARKKILASEYTEELNFLLEDDIDVNGAVDPKELQQAVKGNSKLIDNLFSVGIGLTLEGLMTLVDNMSNHGTRRVVVDHFVEKLVNLAGNSSASALVDVKYEILENRRRMDAIERKLEQILTKLN